MKNGYFITMLLLVLLLLPAINVNSTTARNLTELGFDLDLENFPTIDDMNEINSIKKLGAQATNEVNTFTSLIDNVAGTCAYKMEQDVFNTTLAQMCADLMIDYANTLRNFTESNQNITDKILYG